MENYTRHFCPSSGSVPKLKNQKRDYKWTNFAYGSNLGPNQTARHSGKKISSHAISYINDKHVTGQKLDKSIVDIINLYHKIKLPKIWGDGIRASTDGAKFIYMNKFFLQNIILDKEVMVELHIIM